MIVRTLTIVLVGYAGFLRFDELSNLKESDVQILEEHMELFIESSKADQYRDGAWVVMARTPSKLCPVAMMERYQNLAQITSQDLPIFRGITNTSSGGKLRKGGSISYSRMREVVLDMLSAVGLDKCKLGLHSLRSGGASAAANAGVPDRGFQRHGWWQSENAKDGYIQDALDERLTVSCNLGL